MNSYVPPTPDEIQRVGEYWTRMKRIACQHDGEMVIGQHEGWCCSLCGQQLVLRTEEQIRAFHDNDTKQIAREALEKLRGRGGVAVVIDGEVYEFRASMLRVEGGGMPGFESHEIIVLALDDFEALLRATEVKR